MQFHFDIHKWLKVDCGGIAQVRGSDVKGNYMGERRFGGVKVNPLSTLIDSMGGLSSRAQKLKTVVTQTSKFSQTDQRLYFLVAQNRVVGLIKIGEKKIFHTDVFGSIKELNITCVLDFYVHESCQRRGFGKKLYEGMLGYESKRPEEFAYDRPSSKFIGFLAKHYSLKSFTPQNNSFVIFDRYFSAPKRYQSQPRLPRYPKKGYQRTAQGVLGVKEVQPRTKPLQGPTNTRQSRDRFASQGQRALKGGYLRALEQALVADPTGRRSRRLKTRSVWSRKGCTTSFLISLHELLLTVTTLDVLLVGQILFGKHTRRPEGLR